MMFFYSLYHLLWSFAGAFLYGHPSKKISVVGVTGTKGKSTTLALLAHIFSYADRKVALVSSSHTQIGGKVERNQTGNSMPGRFFLQRFLRRATKENCSIVFLEVTSQGVVQHRHRFIRWDGAVFLDIHPEHLEAHGSFRNYLRAKISFFTYVAKRSQKKSSGKSPHTPRFFAYAHDPHSHLFEHAAHPYPIIFFSDSIIREKHISVPETLPGDFNRVNIAAAYSVARAFSVPEDTIRDAIGSFPGLLGRMSVVSRKPVYTVVDYAHTPDSLEAVYRHLASHMPRSDSRMLCVLGACGGGRDSWKRPIMGALAARYCDTIILTNEDPYDEDPGKIIADIRQGIEGKKFSGDVYVVPERDQAIVKAISLAREGDVLVCTGKGSENAIHVADGKRIPWAESEFVFVELQRQGKYQKI